MSDAFWIGTEADTFTAGQTGFLVEIENAAKGWTRHELRDHPPKTNRSFQPMLYGWCGSYNDVVTTGCGIGKIERVARNGRGFVRILTKDEALPVLEELGYPDLAGQFDRTREHRAE